MRAPVLALCGLAALGFARGAAALPQGSLKLTDNPSDYLVTAIFSSSPHTLKAEGFDAQLAPSQLFHAYCVDVDKPATTGAADTVTVGSTDLLQNGAQVAWLFNTFAGSVATDAERTGLQVAIWEAEYENAATPYALGSGNFKLLIATTPSYTPVTSAVKTYAESYLAQLSAADYSKSKAVLYTPSYNANAQRVIGPAAVPELSTLFSLGGMLLGGAGFSLARRRR